MALFTAWITAALSAPALAATCTVTSICLAVGALTWSSTAISRLASRWLSTSSSSSLSGRPAAVAITTSTVPTPRGRGTTEAAATSGKDRASCS